MPTALPDTAVTTPDTPVTLSVLSNDSGTGLAIAALDSPIAGTAVANADGTVTYTPNAGFIGVDSFTYTMRDDAGATATAAVTITVAVPNRPPVARDDTVTVAPGVAITIDEVANDNDPDGDSLRLVALDLPPHGNISASDGQLHYRSEQSFSGIDSFAYTVSDGRGGVATATVRVNVTLPNQPPVAHADSVATTVGTPVAIDVLSNDADPEGAPLTLAGLDLPSHGTLAVGPGQQLLYTPAAGFEGVDRFVYTVTDAAGASAEGEVTVRVEAVNTPPVAGADTATTEAGTPVTIDLLANDHDPEGDPLSLAALSLPANGLVKVQPDQRLLYTPNAGFVGIDSFTYTVVDGRGAATSAVVTVTVTPPAAPVTFVNGYRYRRKIVVPRASVVGTKALQGFPLMVALAGDWLKDAARGGRIENSAGFDIRFEFGDGSKLAHEIERFDPAVGALRAWVRLPSLDPTADIGLFFYYGKPGLTVDEADPASVWRDYLAVWHLPDGRDRTGHGRDLRTVGTITTGNLLGDAASFDGGGVLVQDSPTWLNGQAGLSCQLWIAAAASGSDRGFLAIGTINGSDASPGLGIRYDAQGFSGGGSNVVTTEWQISDGRIRLESSSNLQTTAPQQLAVTWAQGGELKLYADGAVASTSFLTAIARQGTTQLQGPLQIGAGALDSAAGGWRGLIDEARFRSSALDPGWLATEHANQADPDAFMGVGGEDAFADSAAAPVGLPVVATTTIGTAVDIDVLSAIGAAAGSVLGTLSTPAHGTAAIQDGKVRYTPTAAFSGTDRIAYTVTLGAKSAVGQISITVTAASTDTSPAQDKPWGGLFYGNPTHGDTVQPTQIKVGEPAYFVVPVERSGSITGIFLQLRMANVASEIHGSVGDYSAGDGGKIRFQLRTVGADGLATSTVLAQTVINHGVVGPLCTNGVRNPGVDDRVVWTMTPAVPVTAGQKIAIWAQNEGTDGNWSSTNLIRLYAPILPGTNQSAGPFYGDGVYTKRNRVGFIDDRPSNQGFWELHYADGKAAGNPYWFGTGSFQKSIGGSNMVRQKFTVQDYTRTVNGLWLRAWYNGGSPSDMIVRLENSSGSLIEQLSIPRASFVSTSAAFDATPEPWVRASFVASRTLTKGSTYYLRMSATTGTYFVQPIQLAPASIGSKSRNRWDGAYAQYSIDGGVSWRDGWDRSDRPGQYTQDVDLSLAFTVLQG